MQFDQEFESWKAAPFLYETLSSNPSQRPLTTSEPASKPSNGVAGRTEIIHDISMKRWLFLIFF